MHRRQTLGSTVIIAALAMVLALTPGAGGEPAPPQAASSTPPRDVSLESCDANFDTYQLGPSFQGLELAAQPIRQCSDPQPVATESAGGKVDPESLGRNHSVTWVYGDCAATSDMGCAPPLQVQTWPACERSPADYTFGEPEHERRLEPTETFEVRGVPARFYGDERLELSAGVTTIVLFGSSKKLLLDAASSLSTAKGAPDQVSADDPLPAPVKGAQDGTLAC